MMKQIQTIRILLLVLISMTVRAQYVPHSGQPFQFAPVYNPAFTGMESYNDLKLGYRYQWTGFNEFAPKFVNLNYNVRIQEPLDLNLNALRTSHADTRNSIPKSKQLIQGLGGIVFNEKVGLVNRVGAGFSYAVHYPLNERTRLAGGLAAILENTRLKVNEIYLGANPDPDSFYDHLLRSGTNQTELGIRAGLLIYTDDYYFGFSYFPVAGASLRSSDVNYTTTFYRASFQAGYSHPLNPDIVFRPSIVTLWQMNNKMLVDFNTKFYFYGKGWAGVTYRTTKSGVGNIGININEKFAIAYSFEFSLGRLQQFSGGSHEVILSARLKNYRSYNQRTW